MFYKNILIYCIKYLLAMVYYIMFLAAKTINAGHATVDADIEWWTITAVNMDLTLNMYCDLDDLAAKHSLFTAVNTGLYLYIGKYLRPLMI